MAAEREILLTPESLSTEKHIRMAAEGVIAYMVRAALEEETKMELRSGGMNIQSDEATAMIQKRVAQTLGQMDVQTYLQKVHEVSTDQCIYTTAMTGLFLQRSGLFDQMSLVQSRVLEDTKWEFDTYLLLRDAKTQRYFAVSPPLYEMPKFPLQEELVTVLSSDSLDGIVDLIRAERPGSNWPPGRQMSKKGYPQATEGFYRWDIAHDIHSEGPHVFSCIASERTRRGFGQIDTNPVRLATLAAFD